MFAEARVLAPAVTQALQMRVVTTAQRSITLIHTSSAPRAPAVEAMLMRAASGPILQSQQCAPAGSKDTNMRFKAHAFPARPQHRAIYNESATFGIGLSCGRRSQQWKALIQILTKGVVLSGWRLPAAAVGGAAILAVLQANHLYRQRNSAAGTQSGGDHASLYQRLRVRDSLNQINLTVLLKQQAALCSPQLPKLQHNHFLTL